MKREFTDHGWEDFPYLSFFNSQISTLFMSLQTLKTLYQRDLNRLKEEISLYQSEERLWHVEKGIANSGGNLCLHLVGNLQHFVGKGLGNTGYVRDREFEFAGKGVPKDELIQQVENTREVVLNTLDQLTEEDLAKDHPIILFGRTNSIDFILMHLSAHLTYHLGQINYHRRLLDG